MKDLVSIVSCLIYAPLDIITKLNRKLNDESDVSTKILKGIESCALLPAISIKAINESMDSSSNEVYTLGCFAPFYKSDRFEEIKKLVSEHFNLTAIRSLLVKQFGINFKPIHLVSQEDIFSSQIIGAEHIVRLIKNSEMDKAERLILLFKNYYGEKLDSILKKSIDDLGRSKWC